MDHGQIGFTVSVRRTGRSVLSFSPTYIPQCCNLTDDVTHRLQSTNIDGMSTSEQSDHRCYLIVMQVFVRCHQIEILHAMISVHDNRRLQQWNCPTRTISFIIVLLYPQVGSRSVASSVLL